jgi:hypothetical protein
MDKGLGNTTAGEEEGMTLKSIVKKWLTDNGYDGLYMTRCGCRKNDLFSCNSNPGWCAPGYIKWGTDQFGYREWAIGKRNGKRAKA